MKQIDAICQFLILDKEARVDFKKLNTLSISWSEQNFLKPNTNNKLEEKQDLELCTGMTDLQKELGDEVIDDLLLPVDLIFSYQEGEKLLGILPIFNEDQVSLSLTIEFKNSFS